MLSWRNFFYLLCALGAVILCSDVVSRGADFVIFHTAAQAWWRHENPYLPGLSSGQSFKYPPWTLPIFLPFGLLPLKAAELLWGIGEAASIAYAFRWVRRAGVSFNVAAWVTAAFWFIWVHNALYGQITLIVLALSLGLGENPASLWPTSIARSPKVAALNWILSYKILSLSTTLGYLLERPRRGALRALATNALGSALLMGLIALPLVLWMHDVSPHALLESWRASAVSSSTVSEFPYARTGANPSLSGAIVRMAGAPATDLTWDFAAFVALFAALSFLWARRTSKAPWPVRWAGWLAIGTITHPLIWFHSMALAYPLACFAIDRAIRSRLSWRRTVAIAGLICTTILTRSLFAQLGLVGVGETLEYASIKSWGVVLLILSLV